MQLQLSNLRRYIEEKKNNYEYIWKLDLKETISW